MMLVQKPLSALPSAPSTTFTHRRHPSAPVVVQPTRTPGLLTLSKPIKPAPQRQLPSQQRRDTKTAPRASKQASGVVRAQTVTPSAEVQPVVVQVMPSTPSPQPRGRTQAKQAKGKAETYRSVSHSSIRGKHGRQPSPPIAAQQPTQLQQTPSQAEATVVPPIKSTNLFDPFLDNSNSPPPSPLASKPSGKLARRRQQQQPQFATPSKAIPVPNAQRTSPSNLSRSDPLPSRMRPRPVPKRSSTYHDFPVCDDMTEVADNDYALSPPPTPRRPTTNYSGPQTAPLSARTPGAFPFINLDLPTPPSTKRGTRKHQRVPSEGVFNMSSDEDVSTGSGGLVLNANVQVLLGMGLNKRSSLPSSPFTTPRPARAAVSAPPRSRESSPSYDSLSREKQLEREASEKAGYFASSMFQNSPSPEELPDPLFL